MVSKSYKAKVLRDGLTNMVSAFGRNEDDYVLKGIRINILNQPKFVEQMFNISNLNTGENFSTNDKERFFIKLEKILSRGVV